MASAELYDLKVKEAQLKNLKNSITRTLLRVGNATPLIDSIVHHPWPDLRTKYTLVDISAILIDNCKNLEDIDKVIRALNILIKYSSNLLSPVQQRPGQWNVIDFQNPIYREKVEPIKGTREILHKLGYVEPRREGLAFPASVEPNREKVAEVYVELLAAKTELLFYLQNSHLEPRLVEQYLPFMNRPKDTRTMLGSGPKKALKEAPGDRTEAEPTDFIEDVLPNIPLMVLEETVSLPPGEEITVVTEVLATDKCDICGKAAAEMTCHLCDNKNLCLECDGLWHQHPKRRTHTRVLFGTEKQAVSGLEKMEGNSVANAQSKLVKTSQGLPSRVAMPLVFGQADADRNAVKSPTPNNFSAVHSETKKGDSGGNDDDDIQSMLSKARHPPAFYVPPPSFGVRLQNGETNSPLNHVSVKQAHGDHVRQLQTPKPKGENGTANQPLSLLTTSASAIQRNLLHQLSENPAAVRERNYDRSASASATMSSRPRASELANVESALYWNCEHCTFRNSLVSGKKRNICEMCNRTNDSLQPQKIEMIASNAVPSASNAVPSANGLPSASNAAPSASSATASASNAVPSASSHFMKAVPGFEPTADRNIRVHQPRSENWLFNNKFVEIQDEVLSEKKRAMENFQKLENQRLKQGNAAIGTLIASQSMRELNESPGCLPMPGLIGGQQGDGESAVSKPSAVMPAGRSRSSVEFREPVNHHLEPNDGHIPINKRQVYHSKFVDAADEIYLEKKAAQERFRRMESSTSEAASEPGNLPRPADEAAFEQNFAAGPSGSRFGAAAFARAHDRPDRTLINAPVPVLKRFASNRLSEIEQLEHEKRLQDMHNEGLMVVRLVKAIEANGFMDVELRAVLSLHGSSDPYSYYVESWSSLINSVVMKIQDPSIRESKDLIRASLAEALGDVEKAVKSLIPKWQGLIEAVMKDCGMEKTPENQKEAADALAASGGKLEAAKCIFVKRKFKDEIWSRSENVASEADSDDTYHRTTKRLNEEMSGILSDKEEPRERRIRMILAETDLAGWQRAENVLTILETPSFLSPSSTLADVVDAVKNRGTVEESRQFLQQQCEICFDTYPSRLIKSMGCCQCKICTDCTKGYFEVIIREQFVRNLVCPVCSLPEIDSMSEQTEMHFQFLLLMLHNLISTEVYELFQTKLRDWNLMMDPLFRWCASNSCKSGFLINPGHEQNKIECPHCGTSMCQKCKKLWEDQHENLTCEDFQSWKEDNDPEVQALGLARHLEENGIECPRCKCRYSLAKGGCMHFTCIQCRHEFCSGCLQPFRRGKNCTVLRSCAKAGLHCHHPRDCLFYLRDRGVVELQKLLQDNNIPYDTEPSQTRLLAGPDRQRCSVMEQKQTQNGFKDEPCGKEVPENFAGLCELHYKEYLVGLINKNYIDPANVMKTEELMVLLKRVDKTIPKKQRGENDDHYKEVLLKMIRQQLPLPQRQTAPPRGAVGGLDQSDACVELSPYDTDCGHWISRGLSMHGEIRNMNAGSTATEHSTTLVVPPVIPPHLVHPKRDSGYSSLTH